MKSNYKRIGQYVRQVKKRNTDLAVMDLKGINIDKVFMPSVANTTGTDLSKYKIVRKYQFAFNPMHVGRDEVLPISMLETKEPVIVSPAYVVFKVIDPNELDPEYLMMWLRRPEFDRNAWFTTDSSVRGGFSWDDFCDMTLPVPHIDIQREIVREYNTVVDRIRLNEELIQKLEETAQAIYKQWFVDFEFPISKEYAESVGKPELEGMPYQSSGGEMAYSDELDMEIPIGWYSSTIKEIAIEIRNHFTDVKEFVPTPYIGLEHMPQKSIALKDWEVITSIGSNKLQFSKGDILFGKLRPYLHKIGIAQTSGICSTDIIVFKPKHNKYLSLLLFITFSDSFIQYANSGWSGTRMPRTNWQHISGFVFAASPDEIVETFETLLGSVVTIVENKVWLNRSLKELLPVLLGKMTQVGSK